jgi:phospholipase C
MAHMVRDDIPFHFALADAFTSCDAYHCSVMGPTDPNRYYMFTGYTGNDGQGGGPDLSNGEVGYSWGTYAERLERAGVSWKVYQDAGHGLDAAGGWGWADDPYIGNYGDNSLLYFNNYRNAKPGEPLYEKARTGTDARNGESFFHILEADVRDDTLPQISWIAAPEAFSEHGNWPTNYGAWYISKVLDALTSNPDVWSKTALLITYDENDGYFDHVVPPFPPPTPLQGASTVEYDHEIRLPGEGLAVLPGPYGLGQRVPMIVVSPWSKGGYVCSQTFDHTSIIQFMEARFGVHEPNISAWRRTVSGDLTSAFNFHDPDPRDVELPDTSGYRPPDDVRHPNYVPAPPAEQALPKQEPGLRPARPLPYNLVADACVETPLDVRIDFANHGTAGASFLVTSAILEIVPQTYTVEAGKSLSGRWVVAAGYDLSVHGPNGFFRQYAGIGLPGPEVTATEDGATGTVRLVLSNRGLLPVSLTVTDGYGQESAATYTVIPGQTIEHLADPRASNHWYDLSVKSNLDSHYQRRFAGHVETGAVSTSDPAIRTS